MQITLTLKMTTAQVLEMSVTVNNSSLIQDYVYPDDRNHPAYEMIPINKSINQALLTVSLH